MVNSSADFADSGASTPDSVSAPEMLIEMADVAGAMFSLLLLRTQGSPGEGIPLSAVAEPVDPPAVLTASVAPSQASAPPEPVPVPVLVLDSTPTPALTIAPIAMPASLPMLDYVPEPVAPEASVEPELAFPVTGSAPSVDMTMLSEIGFLDD